MGFEPLVNQRLLPPTFPRYTKIKTREETIEYSFGLVDRLKAICGIMEINNLHVALVSVEYLLHVYLVIFSKMYNDTLCVFPPRIFSSSSAKIRHVCCPGRYYS